MSDQTKDADNVSALFFGLNPDLSKLILANLPGIKVKNQEFSIDFLLESQTIPSIVFCGKPPEGITASETAQTMRSCFLDAPIFLVLTTLDSIDKNEMIKNGFNDVFFLPFDSLVMKEALIKTLPNLSSEKARYRPVKLIDIKEDTVLDFDTYVFLPMNKKHVKLTAANSKIEAHQLNKLKDNNVSSLMISEEDSSKFYEYTAKTLKSILNSSGMSETQKEEALRSSVREIISGLFSDSSAGIESGRKAAEDCRNIVKQFMSDSKVGGIYDKILSISGGQNDTYSHAMNVSGYAALFAMALGLKTVEDVALAGLLHDIGLAKVPIEIQQKDPQVWTTEERKLYESHPEHSVDMIKNKKMAVSETVMKAILQHHERTNGSGFPKGPNCGKIILEAQVLAFANEFDRLLELKPGKVRVSPAEAAQHFFKMAAGDPTKAIVEMDILKKILSLFPK